MRIIRRHAYQSKAGRYLAKVTFSPEDNQPDIEVVFQFFLQGSLFGGDTVGVFFKSATDVDERTPIVLSDDEQQVVLEAASDAIEKYLEENGP